tara:strand:- start:3588 stop:3947 length:360 start_codon:yes stop_codon:yes gene_type:complete
MATLTTTLTLSSTDALTDALSITTTDSLTITNPSEFSRKPIATGSAQSVIASNSAFSYVYLKVISGANSTDWLQVLIGGHAKLKIRVGEMAFMPIYNAQAITAESYGGACVVEYGAWSV